MEIEIEVVSNLWELLLTTLQSFLVRLKERLLCLAFEITGSPVVLNSGSWYAVFWVSQNR